MGGFYSGPVVGYLFAKSCRREPFTVIDFKGAHCPKAVIVHAVFFYVRYAVSYRDLEKILAERGVAVEHATLNRWVVKYSPLIAAKAQAKKRATAVSWQMPSRDIAMQCPAG
jgi:transposase-like protein